MQIVVCLSLMVSKLDIKRLNPTDLCEIEQRIGKNKKLILYTSV